MSATELHVGISSWIIQASTTTFRLESASSAAVDLQGDDERMQQAVTNILNGCGG